MGGRGSGDGRPCSSAGGRKRTERRITTGRRDVSARRPVVITTPRGSEYSTDPETGLLLPSWVLQPRRADLDELVWIEDAYRGNWVGKELYESWLARNSGQYQLGSAPALMDLWKERLESNTRADTGELILTDASTRTLRLERCKMHGALHVQVRVNKLSSRKALGMLNDLFPWSSEADKAHTNLDVKSLVYWVWQKGDEDMRKRCNEALLLLPVGHSNITATAWVVHAIGNPEWGRLAQLVRLDKKCCMDTSAYQAYWKGVSVAVRRTGRWVDGSSLGVGEITKLAYLELAVGRSKNVTDWIDEEEKRTRHQIPLRPAFHDGPADARSNELYLEALRVQLEKIVAQLIPTELEWKSWEEFVETRQAWISSGSSGGKSVLIDGKRVRLNKHAYLENVPSKEICSWLYEMEPIIKATASEKFEMGKSRAIYGTSIEDYFIMSYVIAPLEKRMHQVDGIEFGLHGWDEVRSFARRAALTLDPELECTMIDFADFNYQHTLQAQAAVFAAITSRLELIGARPDVVRASRWCADALLNQWCRFPNGKTLVRVVQGLFSGVRGTNFINTLLNLAYFQVANCEVKAFLSLEPRELYHIHQGDDVWISNKNRLWAIAVFEAMCRSMFVFQKAKQLFGQGLGEFLRVLYSKGEAIGYLARPVATMIVGQLQSTEVRLPRETATARASQTYMLLRRGLGLQAAVVLWWALVPDSLRVKIPGKGGVDIPLSVALADHRDGGLGIGPPGTIACRVATLPALPVSRPETAALESAIGTAMSKDWVKWLSGKVQQPLRASAIEEGLHRLNAGDSLREIDKQKELFAYSKAMTKWKAKWTRTRECIARGSRRGVRPLHKDELAGNAIDGDIWWAMLLTRAPNSPKSTEVRAGAVYTITGAVAASPFKDIATAQVALNLGTRQAAVAAIQACPNPRLRENALTALGSIERYLAPAVVTRILSGIRGMGLAAEAYLHPVVLSWAGAWALDGATTEATIKGITTVQQWDTILEEWQARLVGDFVADPTLIAISQN